MTSNLVTGGAGAIGSHLVAALLRRGDEVTVIDDLSSGHRDLVPARARFIEGSVENDEAIAMAFATKPDRVFHLAALFANQNSVDHPERDLAVNGHGIVKVLRQAERSGVRKLLYASSSCVYGHKPVMSEDDVAYDLETPYAITKLLGEHYCRYWSRQTGLDTVILRLFNTYGPHEYPGHYRNVIPNFLKLAMEGKPLPIMGTGEETRDFNYVEDVVQGMMAAMDANTPAGEVYNLASGVETRIGDLARLVNEITGNKAGIELKPRRSWDRVLMRRGRTGKAQDAFGFVSATKLVDGVNATYRWLKSI